MKIDRLVGIIMILLQRDKATTPKLTRQTINRDIEDVSDGRRPGIWGRHLRCGLWV